MSKYTRIGEGTYGCVIEPSLHCKTKQSKNTYKKRVSKVMLTRHADEEMREYGLISKADPNQRYYLGKPIICKVKDNRKTRKAIKKCKRADKYLKNINDTSLIIMENGGINLSILSDNIKNWKNTPQHRKKIRDILFEFRRLFEGIQVFLKNDIIHHDIKPQNVVYNMTTNRMNIIDFGLMRNFTESVTKSKKSANWITAYAHWSYPLETQFLNHDKYMDFVSKTPNEKKRFVEKMRKDISNDSNDKFTDSFYIFCSYIVDPHVTEHEAHEFKKHIINDYADFITKVMNKHNYNEVLKQSFKTYDTYGIGLSIAQLTFAMKSLIHENMYNELREFAYKLVHPNVFKRISVDDALQKYDDILRVNFS